MKKIFSIVISFGFSLSLFAQLKPAGTPSANPATIKKSNTNNDIIPKAPAATNIQKALPSSLSETLVFYKWKASRVSKMGTWEDVTYTAPDVLFSNNGTVSCNGTIHAFGNNQTMKGTYSVSGNNVTINVKDSIAAMSCYLTYDKIAKTLKGSYQISILTGHAAGNSVGGDIKFEINS